MKCFFRRPLKSFRDEVKMKEELKIRFLSDLIDFKNGKSIKPSSGNIPIYGGNGILGYTEKYNYNNILIIGRVGAYCGSIHYHKEKCWVSDNAIAGEVKSDYSIDYLYYLMKSLNLNDRQVGSSQPLLTQGVLNNISVKIYESSQTQQSIAAVLSALDKKIALNKQINARLEQMAKTLYDYWFVQFDFPDANGKPYKSSGGEMVFDETLKREIPKGWKSGNILNIANLLGGGTPSKSSPEYWNGNIPFFTPTDCDNSIFILDTADRITDAGLCNSSTRLFKKHSIFITARGSVGRSSINAVPMAMNQSCYAFQAKENVSYTFLFFLIRELIMILEVKATGSVFNSIVSSDIETTNLVISNKDLIMKFGEYCEPLFNQIETNLKQNHQLTQLRDFLLPMLMNGQISVAE